ncbi:heme exporter protein CcmD [Martelella alba]|uniref:Heme exporter protein D n=1 Tax=Martelella alba TaxID=2590451 RepID=A0ABY2SHU3_9HYPH|nr:heme exporter protein CcmD [Martelella alba]TKI03865.1 heme exporter protein CcmD [Martelella alba]
MRPAFNSWAAFFAMGGYAVYVWLAVAATIGALAVLLGHTLWRRRALLAEIRRLPARRRRITAHRSPVPARRPADPRAERRQ